MKIKNTDQEKLQSQEFLITNGIGGYSSSTISFANTRKYHGLLVATNNPPTQRNVLVHKLEERIKLGDEYFDLSTNQYGEKIHPKGYQYLLEFERQPVATWTFKSDSWMISKKIMMVPESNTSIIAYTNLGSTDIELELHPLFTSRDYHSILHQNHYDFYYEHIKKGIKVHPYLNSKPTFCGYSSGNFVEHRTWYKGFHYDKSAYRGLEAKEDSYRIGYIKVKLQAGKSTYISFSDEENKLKVKPATIENKLRSAYLEKLNQLNQDHFIADLISSGDQFLVKRASTNSQTILAGYHWFTDWGRDTMISMRGLTISTGRKKESESILKTFFEYLDQGMLPNRFPDYAGQEVEYNTIDATLWLFIVMYEYFQKFGDKKFIKKFIKQLEDILHHHIKGTRYQIRVNDTGFVQGGQDGVQLTWMDAKVDGYVVTPRVGAPVEINVLWYNALMIFKTLSKEVAHKYKVKVDDYIKLCKKNFKKSFWNEKGYLNDFIDYGGVPNDDFRCNQIYAVSLPFSLLTKKEEKQIVNQVKEKLLTDYGLRTLDQDNEAFVAVYQGGQWSRDTAYHQGTVWPFFIGDFFEAYLKVNKYSKASKREVLKLLKPLKDHFYNSDCIHGISEIFDGKNSRDGRGCINQSWSVACLLYTSPSPRDATLSRMPSSA